MTRDEQFVKVVVKLIEAALFTFTVISLASIVVIFAFAFALAAEPPTEPGKYELTETVDTVSVCAQTCCESYEASGGVLFYRFKIDTTRTWTREIDGDD